MNLKERADQVLSRVLGHYSDAEVVQGKGAYLYGPNGEKYLDFASGIAVTSTGHCHPQVVKAAVDQTKKLIHNCAGVTYNETNVGFAEDLQKIVPIKDARIFLCQSGSEAVEGALKAAKYFTKKSGIIALENGFHGRTMGALSITSSKRLYTEGYGPLVPNTYIVAPDLAEISKVNDGNIAAVITELVQGEAGYRPQDKQFMLALREYCTQNGICLIIDEVQTGFLRTGKMFACEWYGFTPDIMSLSKGIASGFPLGAVVMKKEISDNWTTSTHGGTFTGNLVSCAAGRATIKVLRAELPKMAKKIEIFEKSIDLLIKKYPTLYKFRQGVGFMIGLQCKDKATNTELRRLALTKGLLLINSGPEGDVIRFAPPVIISPRELRMGLGILDQVSAELI